MVKYRYYENRYLKETISKDLKEKMVFLVGQDR
jgi:hypothetical protein